MGHDISAIGNHNLNTSSIKELAEDIVSRIDINIEYYKQNTGNENEFVIDKIIKHKDFKTFRLFDDTCYKQKESIYPNFALEYEENNEFEYLIINKENYHNSIPYISRWWTFCRFFTEKYYEDESWLKTFINYRKEIKNHTVKLGGNKIYYLDDQSSVLEGVGQGSEWEMNWNDFEKFILEKTSHLMLDIPKFMKIKTIDLNFINLMNIH